MRDRMRVVGLLPALAIIGGAVCAPALGARAAPLVWLLPVLLLSSVIAWHRNATRVTVGLVTLGFWTCGVVLTSSATEQALRPPLRQVLDKQIGGFDISTLGPEGRHDPILARGILTEDASPRDDFVSLRLQVTALRLGGVWQPAGGAVAVSVGGAAPIDRVLVWRAQRTIETPITFRRPVRFLNDGVSDFEDALARDGTTLLGTIKSALVVDVIARGGPIDEIAADIRAHVRTALATWIAPHSAVSAAIAAAVLIGDRTGVPEHTRDALQAAGTYHVIAISGGNIAIVAAGASGLLALIGIRGRIGALLTIFVLLAYAAVVTAGPSVWRATLMAIAYFAARVADHRTPVWQAIAVAGAMMLVVRPLDLADPGFILTFGATMALVEGARRGTTLLRVPGHAVGAGVLSWIAATVIASLAVEAVLLPVSASIFSRVTGAGLMLNLLAVPAMVVVQIASMVVAVSGEIPLLAYGAGWTAHAAASALVSSADLVTVAPWLTARVPPPDTALVLVYYAGLLAAIAASRRLRVAGAVVWLSSLTAIVGGADLLVARGTQPRPPLRLTVFDVGQAESMLLEAGGRTMLVDTGGAPFGGGVDIGRRVLAPALWTRGLRSLDAMLVTHGDPDHLGGALAVADDFRPRQIWEGIRLPQHPPTQELLRDAARLGIPVAPLRAGQRLDTGDVRLRVLHPPAPDWERRRVRNDDSVVIEVVYGDVALLLTGDISEEIERAIAPLLTPARLRILKVAHHGSRTSSSSALLDAWRPHIAVISCGRGNRFGHPTPEVLERLASIGATVLRTDLDGQITIETDGHSLRTRTFLGATKSLSH
jgi:competence protein ComEC